MSHKTDRPYGVSIGGFTFDSNNPNTPHVDFSTEKLTMMLDALGRFYEKQGYFIAGKIIEDGYFILAIREPKDKK